MEPVQAFSCGRGDGCPRPAGREGNRNQRYGEKAKGFTGGMLPTGDSRSAAAPSAERCPRPRELRRPAEKSPGRAMEGAGQEPRAGERGHAVHWDICFTQRGRNRTNNVSGQAQLGEGPQARNYTLLPGQRDERCGGRIWRVPQSIKNKPRNQGEQANSGATGHWNEQENEGRRMRYRGGQGHERARGPWNEQENESRGRRYQGGQAHERARGPWNEQENEGRGRRYQSGQAHEGGRWLRNGQENEGRGRRTQPRENPRFYQNPTPGGAQFSKQPQQVKRIGYKFLENLLQKDPSEVVITLASSPSLKELLSQMTMNPSFLQLVCQVLQKACTSRMDRQSVQQLLGVVKESNFLKICLPQYVSDMVTEAVPAVRHQYPVHITNIISILQELISIFPASSVQNISILLTVLSASINALRASGVDITEETEKNLSKVQMLVQHLQEKRREGTLRADNYILRQTQTDDQGESYRTMTVYPTYNEVHHDEKPFLRPNIVSGRYESTSIYLDTHFRLLREDFVRPLREGILELLESFEDKGLRKKRFDDIRIYFDARIITPVCSPTGIVYKVQFDIKPLRFVRWQNSKRLLYGSLICMSKDHFETCLFATVSNRDNADLACGIVQLCFNAQSQALLAQVQPSDSFLMVETTAYFEAYQHVLEGLQEIQEEDIPFQKYIVECDTQVKKPTYLTMDTVYNFAPLTEDPLSDEETHHDGLKSQSVHVLDPEQWPSMETLRLDESQMQALSLALTKELAIIQGPPGTGKTYVGLKIVQALLTNKHAWQSTVQKPPILVVCYTNHALDQFLEGIYKFQKHGMVRVGGRSNSEVLKQFTLKELRKKYEFRYNLPAHLRRAYMLTAGEMKEAEQELHEGAKHLECTMYGVLHERHLEACIAPQHWDSLMSRLDDEKFYYSASQHSVILEWLGLGVTFFTHNAAENPGGQQEREEEWEGEAEEQLLEIPEEADLIQADRVLEDEEAVKPQKRKEEERRAVHELASMLLAMKLEDQEEGTAQQKAMQWEVTAAQRKKMKQKMKVELRKLSAMTEMEAKAIQDLWQLDLSSRWRLYRLWLQTYQGFIRQRILQHEQQYQAAAERLTELKLQEDLCILKDAQVVGMTTTGAAKYRQILQKLEPRIVIVEEAAEVLEAHTITTLSKACQHLILIGDHQQLRPSANVYDLAKNFNLEVSLFERLVKVNFPFVRLKYQHRMRPEIAQLLIPHIYQDLENHPSVLKYENIKGVTSNLFFVEHDFPEQEIQEGRSHQNTHEAQFVVELCKYFLCQDYLPSQITILTTYTGQLFCLRKLMPAKTFEGVKVHVVDKYQGEENDVILLSLVRSNSEERTGFLQIPNRLEDCGHVFESQGLDHYMDEDDDVIKLKVCPICQTPIRKNLRYGTIVKRWLDEIEKVKEKIQGPAQEIESNRKRLQVALVRNTVLQRNLPLVFLMLKNKLEASVLSTKNIGLIENQLNFYKRVADLTKSLSKIDANERKGLRKRLDEVQKWLDQPRLTFTGQELSDLQSELQRLTYLLSLLARCRDASGTFTPALAAEIASVRQILEGTKKFTAEDEAAVKADLERLCATLPASGLGLSEAERVQVVNAIGCPRGHWFKCKNGHIYVIGECGGAMERSKCPECHEVIGGTNHTLDSTNSLASEMDGATYPAWSETANNMLNFEDLHRLL
ncbi:NFX1-type zinc finger-containing protein 1 [Grus japonensis]|uniref:NFX1-type zinc finger-containing protein 1 n=1 Tax=Grus japonensis TaxID=30415 RepID=A0ABC9XJN1_GRUJA